MTTEEAKQLKVGDEMYRDDTRAKGAVVFIDDDGILLRTRVLGQPRNVYYPLLDVVAIRRWRKVVPWVPFSESVVVSGDLLDPGDGETPIKLEQLEGFHPSSCVKLTVGRTYFPLFIATACLPEVRDLIDRCIQHQANKPL